MLNKHIVTIKRKVAWYKINTQNSCVFLHTTYEQSKKEIKKVIVFLIASKIIKYVRINLIKEMKNLYTDNYKTLLKILKDT